MMPIPQPPSTIPVLPVIPIGVVQKQPININFLNRHRFRVILQRAPSIEYFAQECNLPGLSMGHATQPNPFVDLPIPGDKIQYGDFVMTFPVDEDMTNYKEIAIWIVGLGFPKQFGQYADLVNSQPGTKSDIGLLLLDASSNPTHTIWFRGAFPVSITDLNFDVKLPDTEIQMATASFKYAFWEFEEVNATTPTLTEADTGFITN